MPKLERNLPIVLSLKQMEDLLDAPLKEDASAKGPPWLRFRDAAILELFYSSGLRISELLRLDVRDVDFVDGVVRVEGKGRKHRIVPVGGAALIRLAPAIDAGMARGLAAAESWPSAIGATLLNAIGAWRLIGVASYSIYLWHCIVLAGFRHKEMFGPTWLWWFMAFLSLLTGILSWKYIELRFYSFGTSAQRQK